LEALRLDFDFEVLDALGFVDFEVLLKVLALFLVPFFAFLVAAAETVTINRSAQSTQAAFLCKPRSDSKLHLGIGDFPTHCVLLESGRGSRSPVLRMRHQMLTWRERTPPPGESIISHFDAPAPAGRLLSPLRKGTGHEDRSTLPA